MTNGYECSIRLKLTLQLFYLEMYVMKGTSVILFGNVCNERKKRHRKNEMERDK